MHLNAVFMAARRYDLDPQHILELSDDIEQLRHMPVLIESWVLQAICDVDCAITKKPNDAHNWTRHDAPNPRAVNNNLPGLESIDSQSQRSTAQYIRSLLLTIEPNPGPTSMSAPNPTVIIEKDAKETAPTKLAVTINQKSSKQPPKRPVAQNRKPAANGTMQRRLQAANSAIKSAARELNDEYKQSVYTYALPNTPDPVRYAGDGARETAQAQPHDVITAPWPNSNFSTRTALPPSDGVIMAFRDPRRSHIIYDPNASGSGYSANIYYVAAGSGVDNPSITARMNDALYPTICYATTTSSYAPHGTNLYAGVDEDNVTLIWIDSPTGTTTVTFSGLLVSSNFYFQVRQRIGGVSEDLALLTLTSSGSGTYSYTVPASGYYNFHISDSSGSINNVSAVISDAPNPCSHFCHLAQKWFGANYASMEAVRVDSVALMYSNSAADNYTNGFCVGFQQPGEADWQQTLGVAGTVNSANGAYGSITALPQERWGQTYAKKGHYTFLKPDEEDDLIMKKIATNNGLLEPYSLVDTGSWIGIYIVIQPNTSGSGPPSQAGVYTICWYNEFYSTNGYFERKRPTQLPSYSKDMLFKMNDIPQFHENPFHFMDIVKFANRHIFPIATTLTSAISSALPPQYQAAGAAVGAGVGLLSGASQSIEKMNRAPKPTSTRGRVGVRAAARRR